MIATARPAARGIAMARPAPAPRRVWRRPAWSAGGAIGLALTLLLVAAAVAGSLLPLDPTHQALALRLQLPVWAGGSAAHPLGTDQLGRDLLARVVAGARVSLLVGAAATVGAGAIGVGLGLLAGFRGGRVDAVVSWLVDVQLAVPFVVMAIALTTAVGRGLGTLLATLALTGWIAYARVVRLQARAVRNAPWADAARALGASPTRVAVRHILPNLSAPILVLATQQVAAMILYEAALSYLGLGLGGSTITWGGMVAGGRETLLVAPWVSIVPGGAIALAVLGLNLLGDALIDRS
ncbi:MAG TPA: ABC transporter permease [Thermomicrobiales bacterium]|nr:ABC transporter permease [Thermomicrobiales bacterium]